MKTTVVLPLFAGYALLLATAVVPTARACRYCQQAADPVEVMRFQGQNRNAGSFPLDDSLNTYTNGTPAATPAPVITSAAELPAHPVTVAVAPIAVPALPPTVPPLTAATRPQPVGSVRWADLGLLGLAGIGGWFAWRTRAGRRPAMAA